MRKIKYFGEDDYDSLQEAFDTTSQFDLMYVNKEGQEYYLTIYYDCGPASIRYNQSVNALGYYSGPIKTYDTIDDLINSYIMPDGVPFKDVYEGDNYFFTPEELEELKKNKKKNK